MTHLASIRAVALLRLAIAALLCLAAGPAFAYVGPGAGLTAIGTVLALGSAVLLAIVGFIWYPIKRLFRRRKPPVAGPETQDGN